VQHSATQEMNNSPMFASQKAHASPPKSVFNHQFQSISCNHFPLTGSSHHHFKPLSPTNSCQILHGFIPKITINSCQNHPFTLQ
jgi:hypothetical protein